MFFNLLVLLLCVRGPLGRAHVEDAPRCVFSAAPFSSCHCVVWTQTHLRPLQRSTWEFSSAASLAQHALVRGSPRCMLAAANLSSCHFAVWTPTRLRLLHRPAWEFSSAASLAQPLRAAIAFSQSDGSSHLHKDGVDLSIQQHFVRSALLDSSVARRRRRGTDVLLLRKLALLVVMGRGTSFSAADLSIVLLSTA